MKKPVPNQILRQLMGVSGLNPWAMHDSSSRQQMFGSHIGQTLVVKGANTRRCQTGMEREYGKYTFAIRMPCNGKIIKIINRYPPTLGQESIKDNPETILLYENVETKEIGMLSLTNHFSNHQYFGFKYKEGDAIKNVAIGAYIAKDTIFMDSPSVDRDGNYNFGMECNIAYMTHPAVSEDGIAVSRDILDKFSFNTFETRTVEWGSRYFPLNLYGNLEKFKGYPDIGETVRDDGLLMCLREYNDELSVIEQNVHALMEPDHTFDRSVYAPTGGVVVDIKVHHDSQNELEDPSFGMDAQSNKYDDARRAFYRSIVGEWKRLKSERKEALVITPELHRMVVEGLAVLDEDKQRLIKLYRHTPLDDWRVTFTIQYTITPTDGFKLTDCHGGNYLEDGFLNSRLFN